MNFDSVSILIVNYNVKEYLGNCIDSILQSDYNGEIEIVVVVVNDIELVFIEIVVSYSVNERVLQIVLSGGSVSRVVGFNFDHIVKYEIIKMLT